MEDNSSKTRMLSKLMKAAVLVGLAVVIKDIATIVKDVFEKKEDK